MVPTRTDAEFERGAQTCPRPNGRRRDVGSGCREQSADTQYDLTHREAARHERVVRNAVEPIASNDERDADGDPHAGKSADDEPRSHLGHACEASPPKSMNRPPDPFGGQSIRDLVTLTDDAFVVVVVPDLEPALRVSPSLFVGLFEAVEPHGRRQPRAAESVPRVQGQAVPLDRHAGGIDITPGSLEAGGAKSVGEEHVVERKRAVPGRSPFRAS